MKKQQAAKALKEKPKSDSSNIKKKPSKSSQAFKLFREGKKPTDVAIDLEIPARKAVKLWSQFLKLEECINAMMNSIRIIIMIYQDYYQYVILPKIIM